MCKHPQDVWAEPLYIWNSHPLTSSNHQYNYPQILLQHQHPPQEHLHWRKIGKLIIPSKLICSYPLPEGQDLQLQWIDGHLSYLLRGNLILESVLAAEVMLQWRDYHRWERVLCVVILQYCGGLYVGKVLWGWDSSLHWLDQRTYHEFA